MEVRMSGIDCDGFDVLADAQHLRFDFDEPVTDARSARAALVALAHKARSA
jgi:putative heme iron utilization protein